MPHYQLSREEQVEIFGLRRGPQQTVCFTGTRQAQIDEWTCGNVKKMTASSTCYSTVLHLITRDDVYDKLYGDLARLRQTAACLRDISKLKEEEKNAKTYVCSCKADRAYIRGGNG